MSYTINNKLIAIVFLIVLSACSNLYQLEHNRFNTQDIFANALADEYLAFAMAERNQYDWYDSDYFARKGLAASRGVHVLPEEVGHWRLTPQQANALIGARLRLLRVLKEETKRQYPHELARLQLLYDCWIEEEEEGWQQDDIDRCRMDFMLDIAQFEHKLYNAPKIPPLAAMRVPVEDRHVVYFSFDSANVDESGQDVINRVMNVVSGLKDYLVHLSGYTDTAGASSYNKQLSERRVMAVADEFRDRGVLESKIRENAYGETNLDVPTPDNKPERRNRRVEIIVKGNK